MPGDGALIVKLDITSLTLRLLVVDFGLPLQTWRLELRLVLGDFLLLERVFGCPHVLASNGEIERRVELGGGVVRLRLGQVERNLRQLGRGRLAVELGNDIAFFNDRSLRDDRGDLGLVDIDLLGAGGARHLDELVRAELASGGDEDLEVAELDWRRDVCLGCRRGGRPFIPGDRPPDDEADGQDGEPALTQGLHVQPLGDAVWHNGNGEAASPYQKRHDNTIVF